MRLRVLPRGFGASWAAGIALAVTLSATPASAQLEPGFRLPIDLAQGFMPETAGVRPYTASLSVAPSYDFLPARLGLVLSVDYENPDLGLRFGPRASVKVKDIATDFLGVVLLLEGQATWSTDGDARYGGGLTFDADGLIRVGTHAGWDVLRDGGWFDVSVGIDPTRWFGCVRSDTTGECVSAP